MEVPAERNKKRLSHQSTRAVGPGALQLNSSLKTSQLTFNQNSKRECQKLSIQIKVTKTTKLQQPNHHGITTKTKQYARLRVTVCYTKRNTVQEAELMSLFWALTPTLGSSFDDVMWIFHCLIVRSFPLRAPHLCGTHCWELLIVWHHKSNLLWCLSQ